MAWKGAVLIISVGTGNVDDRLNSRFAVRTAHCSAYLHCGFFSRMTPEQARQMTGLYLREVFARRLIKRVLIVPPAGLVGNWEREMRTLFRLPFRIVRGPDARAGNPFAGLSSVWPRTTRRSG
jgi:hypothetical protein